MSAPAVDWPPEEVLDDLGEYLEALERLVRRVAAIRERYGPMLARYRAWAEGEPRPDGWFETTDVIFGMQRAGDLAGAALRLVDEDLTYGGAHNMIGDERVAQLVTEVTR